MQKKLVATRIRLPYITLIGGFGLVFALQGLLQVSSYDRLHIFLLLMALAVLAQFAATGADVTFEVSSAISLATVPFYGPAAAAKPFMENLGFVYTDGANIGTFFLHLTNKPDIN